MNETNGIAVIGSVEGRFAESADPFEMRRHESVIVLDEEFLDGLYRLEESRFIQVVFLFHRSEGYSLHTRVYHGGEKGVFASRSPHRPSRIGVTVAELKGIRGRELTVRGLDALDGTPVLDIKPYSPDWDGAGGDQDPGGGTETREPRRSLIPHVMIRDTESLLRGAGLLHGHYCPGLAFGVMASVEGLHSLASECGIRVADLMNSDGLEDLIVITECNNCSVDGIQYVTGCTLGNNGLVYRDIGKTAVTLAVRSGKGVRLRLKGNIDDLIRDAVPEFPELFDDVIRKSNRDPGTVRRFKEASREAGFRIAGMPAEDLFEKELVDATLPDYASMVGSVECAECGETAMESKCVSRGGRWVCRECADDGIPAVTGDGISCGGAGDGAPEVVGRKRR